MTRRTTMPHRWAALADAYGGVDQLAATCGVSRVTLWRWAKDYWVPKRGMVEYVGQLAAAKGLPSPYTGTLVEQLQATVDRAAAGAPIQVVRPKLNAKQRARVRRIIERDGLPREVAERLVIAKEEKP